MGPNVLLPCLLSCFAGLAISFFQLNVRKAISSTAFMVLGVSNKFLTVFINQLFMDSSHDVSSIGCVLLAIIGAVLFQQTVKGKGLSQAPPPKPSKAPTADLRAFGAMVFAFCWCAYITISQKAHNHH